MKFKHNSNNIIVGILVNIVNMRIIVLKQRLSDIMKFFYMLDCITEKDLFSEA